MAPKEKVNNDLITFISDLRGGSKEAQADLKKAKSILGKSSTIIPFKEEKEKEQTRLDIWGDIVVRIVTLYPEFLSEPHTQTNVEAIEKLLRNTGIIPEATPQYKTKKQK